MEIVIYRKLKNAIALGQAKQMILRLGHKYFTPIVTFYIFLHNMQHIS